MVDVKKDTRVQVAKFRDKYHKDPARMHEIIEAIGNISKTAFDSFGARASTSKVPISIFTDLITTNHNLLVQAGVSHPSLDYILSISCDLGFFGKLTGAGGGGCCMVCLTDSPTESAGQWNSRVNILKKSLIESGFTPYEVKISVEGVNGFKLDIDEKTFMDLEFHELYLMCK